MNTVDTRFDHNYGREVEVLLCHEQIAAMVGMTAVDGQMPDGSDWTFRDEVVSACEGYIDNRTSEPDFDAKIETAKSFNSKDAMKQALEEPIDSRKVILPIPEPIMWKLTALALVDSAQPNNPNLSAGSEIRAAVDSYVSERTEDPGVATTLDKMFPYGTAADNSGHGIRMGVLPDGRRFRHYY